MALLVRNYYRKHKVRTIQGLIERYAPGVENNVAAYVQSVCQHSGLPPDRVVNLDSDEALVKIIPAMIHHENGIQPYPPHVIAEAVHLAMVAK